MRSKKAIYSYNMIMMVIKISVLVFALIPIYLMIKNHINLDISIYHSESELLIQRLLYGPESLAYTDYSLGRTYPGIIHLHEGMKDKLDQILFIKDNEEMTAKIEFIPVLGHNDVPSPIIYNDQQYSYITSKKGISKGSGTIYVHNELHYLLLLNLTENSYTPVIANVTVYLEKK